MPTTADNHDHFVLYQILTFHLDWCAQQIFIASFHRQRNRALKRVKLLSTVTWPRTSHHGLQDSPRPSCSCLSSPISPPSPLIHWTPVNSLLVFIVICCHLMLLYVSCLLFLWSPRLKLHESKALLPLAHFCIPGLKAKFPIAYLCNLKISTFSP